MAAATVEADILPAVAGGIPAARHPQKTAHQTAEQNLGDNIMKGKAITILLVEDDPAHAEIVRRNLGSFRVANRIIHVEDGQAALDYLFHQGAYADSKASPRPNLILLDLRLPKVDGLEVLRRVKEDEELKRLPTVVLTTSGAEADLVNAYTHGVGSYLVKPVDFEKFSKLMEIFGFYWLAWNRFPD
jgi:CheY-like chemotaxis protein